MIFNRHNQSSRLSRFRVRLDVLIQASIQFLLTIRHAYSGKLRCSKIKRQSSNIMSLVSTIDFVAGCVDFLIPLVSVLTGAGQ